MEHTKDEDEVSDDVDIKHGEEIYRSSKMVNVTIMKLLRRSWSRWYELKTISKNNSSTIENRSPKYHFPTT